jgi:hypothetical protein
VRGKKVTDQQLDEKIKSIQILKGQRRAQEKGFHELKEGLENIEMGAVDLIFVESFERLGLGMKEAALFIADYYKTIIASLLEGLRGIEKCLEK